MGVSFKYLFFFKGWGNVFISFFLFRIFLLFTIYTTGTDNGRLNDFTIGIRGGEFGKLFFISAFFFF